MRAHSVRALLMGGQACVSHGAAEFTRDLDLAIVASLRNIEVLRKAMVDLHAPQLLVAVAAYNPDRCRRLFAKRPCLELALDSFAKLKKFFGLRPRRDPFRE